MTFTYIFLYFVVFYYGACFSSFINAYAFRYSNGLKISKGRSFCENCGYTLQIIDLLPVFSYIFLGGKCRKCKQKISPQYLISEIVGGILCITCFLRFGFTITAILASFTSLALLCLTLIDWQTMEIPDSVQITLLILAILSCYILPFTLKEKVIGFFAISVPLLLVNLLIQDAFGGGDIKLMAICGFMIGWQNIVLAMFIGLVTGGIYGLMLILKKVTKESRHMPFGPFLAIGIFIALLYGTEIVTAYLELCGIY